MGDLTGFHNYQGQRTIIGHIGPRLYIRCELQNTTKPGKHVKFTKATRICIAFDGKGSEGRHYSGRKADNK